MVHFQLLSTNHIPQVQQLLFRCEDYLFFQDGASVVDDAAEKLFSFTPKGTNVNQKFVFGIYQSLQLKQLVGIIDVIINFPQHSTLTLGLLLLEPSKRGCRLGSEAFRKIRLWALGQDITKIRLGVLKENGKGLRFWKSLGFTETGEVKPYLHHQVIVLEKLLT